MAKGLGKTLAELEHISNDELNGWMAFYQLEPWGCLVEDHRAELGLQLLFAVNAKANAKIPTFIERDPESLIKPDPTPEELENNIRDFFAGKTIKVEAQSEQRALPTPVKRPRKTRSDKARKRANPTK